MSKRIRFDCCGEVYPAESLVWMNVNDSFVQCPTDSRFTELWTGVPELSVVLLSGGIDSMVALHAAVNEAHLEDGDRVIALYVAYKTVRPQELAAVRNVAEHFNVDLLHLGLPAIALEQAEDGYYPNRNNLLLALAASFAESQAMRSASEDAHCTVYIGSTASDTFPDTSLEFFTDVAQVWVEGSRNPPDLCAPLLGIEKPAVVRLAYELGLPLDATWSCYGDAPEPCGTCKACVARYAAMAAMAEG